MFFLNDNTFKSVLKVLLLLIIFLVVLSYYFINCKGTMSLFEGAGRRRKKRRKKKFKKKARKIKRSMMKHLSKKQKREMRRRLKQLKKKLAELRKNKIYDKNKQKQLDLKESLNYIGRQEIFDANEHPLCTVLDEDNIEILIAENKNYFDIDGENKILTCVDNDTMTLKSAKELGSYPSGISISNSIISGNCKPADKTTEQTIEYCEGIIKFKPVFGTGVIATDKDGTNVLSGGRIYPNIYKLINRVGDPDSILNAFDNPASVPGVGAQTTS